MNSNVENDLDVRLWITCVWGDPSAPVSCLTDTGLHSMDSVLTQL